MTPKTTPKPPRGQVKLSHKVVSWPLRLLTALNIGPFGGENSVSATIEAAIALQKGEDIGFELSKSERSFLEIGKRQGLPPALIEYRTLNHDAQEVVLGRHRGKKLGIIWIGAGIFNLDHPFIQQAKPEDWNLWTDANPKAVRSAQAHLEALRARAAHFTYDLMLPRDTDKLNEMAAFLAAQGVEYLVIQTYGVFYALTYEENLAWLRQYKPPLPTSFILNSSYEENAPFLGGVIAAFHNQQVYKYTPEHIEALFSATQPDYKIVWEKPADQTEWKSWYTWIIETGETRP